MKIRELSIKNCLSFYKEHEPVIIGATLAVVLTSLSLGLGLLATSGLPSLSDRLSVMQLILSAVAFVGVFIALMVAIAQFRKSNAKPKIKVAFNEKGEQSFTLTYKDNKATSNLPPLWLINEGTAISQHFQIVVIIPESIINPESIGKILTYTIITRDNGNCIFSYTNDEGYTLFVHKPKQPQDMNLSIAIDNHKCMNLPKNNIKLKYNIYGDWAETQEGELTVNVKKQ